MYESRLMIFIDGRNLYHGQQNYGDDGVEIDINELLEELTEDDKLIRPYWYDSHPEDLPNTRQRFFTFLRTNGFRVHAVALQEHPDGFEEKGLDISLVSDMLHLGYTDAYDEAILVSGDADFIPAIRKIQDLGKKVKVATFEDQLSYDLKKAVDGIILLDDIVSIIARNASVDEEETEEETGELFLQIDDE